MWTTTVVSTRRRRKITENHSQHIVGAAFSCLSAAEILHLFHFNLLVDSYLCRRAYSSAGSALMITAVHVDTSVSVHIIFSCYLPTSPFSSTRTGHTNARDFFFLHFIYLWQAHVSAFIYIWSVYFYKKQIHISVAHSLGSMFIWDDSYKLWHFSLFFSLQILFFCYSKIQELHATNAETDTEHSSIL